MSSDKLLAEWFWTDRWMGSSAFGLPIEARGLYREMLTQSWRRHAQLPNDHDQIRRMIGATAAEWRRAWPKVARFWRVDGDTLVNDTQIEIYADAHARSVRATDRAKTAAQARHKQSARRAQVKPEQCPPSPSPSQTQSKPPLGANARARTGTLVTSPKAFANVAHFSPLGDVPQQLHSEFVRKVMNGGAAEDEADRQVRAFYGEVERSHEGEVIGEDPFPFWRSEFGTYAGRGLSKTTKNILRGAEEFIRGA